MVRTIFGYGAPAGAAAIAAIIASIVLSGEGHGGAGGQIVGYLIMLIALSVIFVAVTRHRDRERGGVIAFTPAFGLELGDAAAAGLA